MNSSEKKNKIVTYIMPWILVFMWIFLWTASDPLTVYGDGLRAKDLTVGSEVAFGKYEQDEDRRGKEELEWRVLVKDEENNRALLIASDCIACMPFHSEKMKVTWEDSYLRQWLNSVFLQEAFSDEERSRIIETDVETRVEEELEEDGVITSHDSVFLLSDEEVTVYFKSRTDRLAGVSAVIHREIEEETEETEIEGGEKQTEEDTEEADGSLKPAVSELTDSVFWWLRTPGDEQDCAECVGAEGSIVTTGYLVIQSNFGVRPVIWVEIDD